MPSQAGRVRRRWQPPRLCCRIRVNADRRPVMADGFADAGTGALGRLVEIAPTHALSHREIAPPAAETDQALLARYLKLVMPAADETDTLAATALTRFGSFAGLLAAPVRELRGVSGFGTHSLSAIKLLHEAALRLARVAHAGAAGAGRPRRPARLPDRDPGARADRAVPHPVPRRRGPAAGRRGAGARHREPHPGLSARGGAPGAGAVGDRRSCWCTTTPAATPPRRARTSP